MIGLRRFSGLVVGAFAAVFVSLPSWAVAGASGDWDGGTTCSLLTPTNFEEYLTEQRSQKQMVLVMFHVWWCKVCQRTFPEFVAASKKVSERGLAVNFAHVDCTDEKALCNKFSVKGYPTIKLFPVEDGAEPRTFKIQRSEASFIKYAERMMMSPVREFSGREEFTKALGNETLSAFVAAVPPGQALPAGLEQAAKMWMDRHIFASNQELKALLPQSVASPPADATLAVLSMGAVQQWPGRDNSSEPRPAVAYYRGSLDNATEVSAWVERNRFPGIWHLAEANFYEFTHASRPAVLLADDPSQVTEATEGALRGAASDLSDDFIFGVVDGSGWHDELADFNIYRKDLPRVLVTEENFEVWIEDIESLRADSIAADLRSLTAGAPLLRQSRKTLSKFFFWLREGQRFVKVVLAYAVQGPTQGATVAFAVLLALGSIVCVLWCVYKLFSILLSDPDDLDYHKAPANLREKKRDHLD